MKMLGQMFISSSTKKSKWSKTFLQHIKTYKKSGVRLREAQLVSPDGDLMAHDGEETMTLNDVLVSFYLLLSWIGFCNRCSYW